MSDVPSTTPATTPAGTDDVAGPPPDQAPGSWAALFRAPNLGTSVVLAGGVALHAVNVYLTTSLLPSVVADIGGLRFYAWNTTLFVFASVVASVFVPRLLDRAGPQPAYAWSLAVFTLGTLACMLAPTVALLLAGRTLQGVGGGLLVGLSYAMIRVSLPATLWTRAAALVSGMWGVGTLVGPAAGGAFAQLGQWRLAFAFLLPCAAGLALLLRGALPKAGPRAALVPIAGLNLVLLAGAVLLVSATSLSGSVPVNLAGVVGAALALAAFAHRERTRAPRILPRTAFTTGSNLPFVYTVVALLAIGSTAETFVPLFGDRLAGLPPLAAGFLGAALAAGWTLGSMPSAGVLGTRRRTLIGLAPIVCAVGLAGLALTARADASYALVAVWVALLVLAGVGVGIAWPHLPIAIMADAGEPSEQASAAASFTTVQMVATALGSALAGTLANLGGVDGDAGEVAHAAMLMYGVLAVSVLLATPAARRIGRHDASVPARADGG